MLDAAEFGFVDVERRRAGGRGRRHLQSDRRRSHKRRASGRKAVDRPGEGGFEDTERELFPGRSGSGLGFGDTRAAGSDIVGADQSGTALGERA